MEAVFALLADLKIANLVRKIAWEVDQKHQTGLDAIRLDPHVSLKQPFMVSDFTRLEAYMHDLAASIDPFEIHITGVQAISLPVGSWESGILWLEVAQTESLKQLHHRLNRELETRFGPVPAQYDGDSYHFHMTIAMGGQPLEVYQVAAKPFKDPPINLCFETTKLALFIKHERTSTPGHFFPYKQLPLGQGFTNPHPS